MLWQEIAMLAYKHGCEWDRERQVYTFEREDLLRFADALIERSRCWNIGTKQDQNLTENNHEL